MADEPKGLRFEVYDYNNHVGVEDLPDAWTWRLVGADGIVCVAGQYWDFEAEARSHIAANRGRLKAAGRSKVFTVDA